MSAAFTTEPTGDKRLGFARPLMPESPARVEELGFLTPAEKLKLNRIRGFDYLCVLGWSKSSFCPSCSIMRARNCKATIIESTPFWLSPQKRPDTTKSFRDQQFALLFSPE